MSVRESDRDRDREMGVLLLAFVTELLGKQSNKQQCTHERRKWPAMLLHNPFRLLTPLFYFTGYLTSDMVSPSGNRLTTTTTDRGDRGRGAESCLLYTSDAADES